MPNVPPRVPRSSIVPFSQRNGSAVGFPVTVFGVELVKEFPATCPRSFTTLAMASGPPKVPKSCITPFCQRMARVSVPKPNKENGSGIESEATPTTSPRLLTARAKLSFPPSSVPMSMTCPSFVKKTPRCSGVPVSGSIAPFDPFARMSPLSLIQIGPLLLLPGCAPKSVKTPLRHLNE